MKLEKILQSPDASIKPEIICEHKVVGDNIEVRPILRATWNSSLKHAVTIGINPSKAGIQKNISDPTVTKLSRFLSMYGFGSMTMLNLFECVSPNQKIYWETQTNFEQYRELFQSADAILIIWGLDKSYLQQKRNAFHLIKTYAEKIYCIENKITGRKPIHPSRMCYENSELVEYQIKNL